MAKFLRPNVPDEVRRGIGMAVDVTIETRRTAARFHRPAILRLVELLLGKRRYQEPNPLNLFRIQNSVEQLIVIRDGHELTFGNVTEIGPRSQENRRRKFRQEMIG